MTARELLALERIRDAALEWWACDYCVGEYDDPDRVEKAEQDLRYAIIAWCGTIGSAEPVLLFRQRSLAPECGEEESV